MFFLTTMDQGNHQKGQLQIPAHHMKAKPNAQDLVLFLIRALHKRTPTSDIRPSSSMKPCFNLW